MVKQLTLCIVQKSLAFQSTMRLQSTVPLVLNCIVTLVVLFAIVFNAVGFYLLLAAKNSTNGNILLMNLAVSQLILCAGQITDNFCRMFRHEEMNTLIWKIGTAFFMVYYLIMFLLTIDRLIAIRLPLRYRVLLTKERLLRCLKAVWAVSIGVGVSVILNETWHEWFEKYVWSILSAVFLLLCFVAYCLIYRTIRARRRLDNNLQQAARRQQLAFRRNTKFFKIVALIIASFILFVLIPDIIFYILLEQTEITAECVLILWFIGIALDPVIYVFLQDNLRQMLKRKLCKINVEDTSQQGSSSQQLPPSQEDTAL